MEAIQSVLDALAWPVFPAEPWPQAAFVSVCLLLLTGLVMLAFPATSGRVLGLDSAATRPGGIGELRPVGGFLAGYALATLMFFDQPVLCAGFGVAMIVAIAVGVPLVTFVIFERWFLLPLPKGPLEAYLGY